MANESTVTTTSSHFGCRLPAQRSSFFCAGRFWVFYDDYSLLGSDLKYKTSTDGSSWSSATTVASPLSGHAAVYDLVFDGAFVHYVMNPAKSGSNYAGIRYRRGTPQSDGTISWSASEQTVLSDSSPANDIQLALDSGNYPWIGYATAQGTGSPTVIKSANNDGTWSTASGFPHTFSGTDYLVIPIALSDSKVCCLKYKTASGTTPSEIIRSILWNGSSWESEQEATSSHLKAKVEGGFYCQLCACGSGADVHLVFQSSTSIIKYVKRTGSSWGSETTIESSLLGAYSSPVISNNGVDLYAFWLHNERIYYKKYQGGSWDANATELFHETEGLTALYCNQCYYQGNSGYLGFTWETKLDDPHNIRHTYLEVPVYLVKSDIGAGNESLESRLLGYPDQGGGADAISALLALFLRTDSGLGADALVHPLVSLIKSDSGAGLEVISELLAILAKSDSGSAIESLQSRLFSLLEQGAGAEAVTTLLAALARSDQGAGVEAAVWIAQAILSSDSGTGADIRAELLGVLSQLDSGSGTESLGSRLLDFLDQGTGRESGKDTSDEASYGSVNGVDITHNFNLSDYIALITSIADPDASVGEVHINSIELNAFTIYNSGRAKSKFRWWIPIDPYDKGDSTFAGLGGRTVAHTKGDTNYVPCVIPSALGGGAIGEWWITDIANTSFVVRNSGNATTTFSWAMPECDNDCKGVSTFAGKAGITITHNLDVHEDYTVLIVPTENPNGHLGAVYITDITANSFKVKNTGVATTSFLWIIFNVRTFSLLAALLESDLGLGTDALAMLTLILVFGDSGIGADALVELSATLSQSDQGAGADALAALFAAIIESDSGSAIEMLQKKIFSSFDQGAGVDTVSELLASLIQSDFGTGIDKAIQAVIVFILLKLSQENKINIAVSQEVYKN